MEFHIEIEPDAEADIQEIRESIADQSPDRAERWWEGLLQAIDTLKRLPRCYPRAPERETYGGEVRQLLYGKRSQYRVLFSIEGDQVRVVAVLHGARGPAGP